MNAYDLAVGGPPPTDFRVAVDERVGIGADTYFAAVSMGGIGVRYFGEYCLVLKRGFAPPETRILDRDSFDVLFSPINKLSKSSVQGMLGGSLSEVNDMILMRVLPRIPHDFQVITSGTVIELALTDQEYIEVHLDRAFSPSDVDQVLESPEAAGNESRILERDRRGLANSLHELEWARRKAELAEVLDRRKLRQRIVTQHGRGYQWT